MQLTIGDPKVNCKKILKGGIHMRISRVRKEQEMWNKVNGQVYRIISVDNENSADVSVAIAAAVDPEDSKKILPETKIEINEKNCICYRFLRDPNPPAIPMESDYCIQNGILCFKNSPAVEEQGELVFLDILLTAPGAILLTAKTDDKNCVALIEYRPDSKRFVNLAEFVDHAGKMPNEFSVKKLLNGSNCALIGGIKSHLEDDTESKKRFLDNYFLYLYSRGTIKPIILNDNLVFDNDLCVKYLTSETDKNIDFFLKCTATVDDTREMHEISEPTYKSFRIDLDDNKISFFSQGPTIKVPEDDFLVSKSEAYTMVVIGSNFVLIGDELIKSPDCEKLKATPYLIDIRKSDKTTHIYTFTDKSCCNTMVMSVTMTRDRGRIVKIE